MSQGPAAGDLHEGTDDLPQPPLEDLVGDEHDAEGGLDDEFELDPEDVEVLESSSSGELPKGFIQAEAGRGPGDAEASEEVVRALRAVREDVGQICELGSEEDKIVGAFSQALLGMMRPVAKAIPVDPSALPAELGDVRSANIIPEAELLVQRGDGGMESIDLTDGANRDLLVEVIRDMMPKLSVLVAERREKIERRMGLLASITKELQNIAEAFSSAVE